MPSIIDTFPKDLNIQKLFKHKLATIPENQEINIPTPMSSQSHFPKLQTQSWASLVKNAEFKPYNRLSFKPTVANWFDDEDVSELQNRSLSDDRCSCNVYNFPHNEDLHYEEDTSFFPDVNGNIVRFNQDEDYQTLDNIEFCSHCNSIQDDNILLTCCSNQHYLCTECFLEQKTQYLRQNAEYEREQRNNPKQQKIQPYKYICPTCNTFNRLNFNIYYGEALNEDIVIIQAFKN